MTWEVKAEGYEEVIILSSKYITCISWFCHFSASQNCTRTDCPTANGGCSQEECFCNSGYNITSDNHTCNYISEYCLSSIIRLCIGVEVLWYRTCLHFLSSRKIIMHFICRLNFVLVLGASVVRRATITLELCWLDIWRFTSFFFFFAFGWFLFLFYFIFFV